MNSQINVRMPEKMLTAAHTYAEKNGYGTIQEFIKETIREKIFGEEKLSKKEIELVKQIVEASNKPGFYRTEKELFDRFKKNK
jgi:metal-responsive CopG/Arc/MetJ family transcriptional regulator